MSNKTFTEDGRLVSPVTTEQNSESFVYLGSVNSAGVPVSEDLGGGTILICKVAGDDSGNLITLKSITSLTSKDDKASRFILPPNQSLDVILVGSISPDLYVELQSGPRRNP